MGHIVRTMNVRTRTLMVSARRPVNVDAVHGPAVASAFRLEQTKQDVSAVVIQTFYTLF